MRTKDAHTLLIGYVKEYEKFQQLKDAGIVKEGKEKNIMGNQYCAPYFLVGSILVAMAAGVLVGSRK